MLPIRVTKATGTKLNHISCRNSPLFYSEETTDPLFQLTQHHPHSCECLGLIEFQQQGCLCLLSLTFKIQSSSSSDPRIDRCACFPTRAHCKYVCTHKLKQHSSLSSAGSPYGEEKTHVYRNTFAHFYLMSDIKMSNHRLGVRGAERVVVDVSHPLVESQCSPINISL